MEQKIKVKADVWVLFRNNSCKIQPLKNKNNTVKTEIPVDI